MHYQFHLPLFNLLINYGYTLDIVSDFKNDKLAISKNKLELLELSRLGKVKLVDISIPRSPFKFIKLILAVAKLKKVILNLEPSIIHCYSPTGALVTRISAIETNIPLVYTAHGFHFYSGSSLLNWVIYYPVELLLSKITDVIITINDEDFNTAKNRLLSKRTLKTNGVGIDSGLLKNKKDYTNVHFERPINFISVGELNKNKNHSKLIKAFGFINKDLYILNIVGTGLQSSRLKRLINNLDLNNNVKLLGYVDNIKDSLLDYDVFIMPSIREGLPISMLEAMASGLVVCGSNIRGIRDLIGENSNGLMFDPNSIKSILKVIEFILNNRNLYSHYGDNNYAKSLQFSHNDINSQILELYRTIHSEKNEKV